MLYIWAEADARALIGDPPAFVRSPAPPELEDFVEFLTKVRRASTRGDGIGVRLYAPYARLGRELLGFLREHKPDADPQPDIAGYLVDGTLERHLGLLDS